MKKEEILIHKFPKKLIMVLLSIFIVFFYSGGMKTAHAQETTKSFNYVCTANTSFGEIAINMNVTPTATVPNKVQANQEFSVSNIQTTIGVDLTGQIEPLKGFINPFNGHVNQLNLTSPSETVNVFGSEGAAIPETPFDPNDTQISFQISGNDTNFNAGEDDVNIHVGEIEAEIYAKLGTTPIDLPVTCTPPEDTLFTTVKVEEKLDNQAPVITLKGDNPMSIKVGETYNDPGVMAKDEIDGDLTKQVIVSGDVNTEKPGEYNITYTADKAGNQATATRTVYVEAAEPDDDENPGDDENPSDGEKPGNGEKPSDGKKPGDNEQQDDGENPEENNLGAGNNDNKPGSGAVLPNTATNIPFTLLIGAILLAAGASIPLFRKYIFN
ncbi:hypothetical protein CAI16_12585 [Virgibacillus dokdonensis]|uniref:Pesticidal crystal protein Cry22Aa Ig-like domain-containing protein n=1 Tax=Virgibacillus dokdonensis TaxID=302167 RepID=A0A3E0WPC5_9BACI|nr:DUF5011 domain-containing protein [Virgibacillus dokdonensis]RFA34053.1 hypothetical protein CAI16_12585 [Virgibacillus dokdonensis]